MATKVTKVFFDTEFTGLSQNTTLISLGLVADTGHVFYAELSDYNKSQVNDWIQENVIDNLITVSGDYSSIYGQAIPDLETDKTICLLGKDRATVSDYLRRWFNDVLESSKSDKIEMWGDCLAYDWILFCELFGGALNLPFYIYYIPFDLATVLRLEWTDPDVNREEFSQMRYEGRKHNALWDARVIKACYKRLASDR
jgi:hypothetical protein